MSDLVFVNPEWVHGLWGVALFALALILLERRGNVSLDKFVSATLQLRLVSRPTVARRWLRIGLLCGFAACCVFALMRPQWGAQIVTTPRAGVEIMICLDVSRSMLSEDVAPNRLERAKAEIRDLLGLLDGDSVGLIAFAGRATILSPLTPDFGFLQLALASADPNSVNRGGTRLEEPIRKALQAFATSGDQSRSILLITDGEDHDSFPLEAAKEARERGIRILAIGFGDEAGSEIRITDPRTGAKTTLRDGDGNPVRTRLDGSMLREIALATEGAYIPAGTGVLDLDSIYNDHIAPLTRGKLDGGTRTVRHDAYPFVLFGALLCLFGAVWATASNRRLSINARRGPAPKPSLLLLLGGMILFSLLGASESDAQPQSVPPQSDTQQSDNVDAAPVDGDATPEKPALELPSDPREAYNLAQRKLQSAALDESINVFEQVRERADGDLELRFSATYNLGWAHARRADSLLRDSSHQEAENKQSLETALEQLELSASWFRRAIELRPDDGDSRFNLEIVLRRALELEDALRAEQTQDISAQLDELISRQREFVVRLRSTVQPDDAEANQPASNKPRGDRRAMRGLASEQLQILSDADALSGSVSSELDTIAAKSEDERSAEEALRTGQLNGLMFHLHRARERIAQARSQLRRSEAERAHRRAAAGLDRLKRGREQLLDPIARLDGLISDGRTLAQMTAASIQSPLTPTVTTDTTDTPAARPAWLSQELLGDGTDALLGRVRELADGLKTGLSQRAAEQEQNESASTPSIGPSIGPPIGQSEASASGDTRDPAQQAAEQRLIANLERSVPLLESAVADLSAARSSLDQARNQQSLRSQAQALESIAEARELFLDLRRLVELVYSGTAAIANALDADPSNAANPSTKGRPADSPAEHFDIDAIRSISNRTLARSERLGPMITDEKTALQLAAKSAKADPLQQDPSALASSNQAQNPQLERLDKAYEHWGNAQRSLYELQAKLGTEDTAGEPADRLELARRAKPAALSARTELEALRRLFFSLLEHLQDTARQQQELSDRTESLLSKPKLNLTQAAASSEAGASSETVDADTQSIANPALGPLAFEQRQLGDFSRELAGALEQQETGAASNPSGPVAPTQPGSDQSAFADAAKLVTEAATSMVDAHGALEEQTIEPARGAQDIALAKLIEAIERLQEQQQDDQQGEQNSQQQQQQQGENQQAEQEQPQGSQNSTQDMAQMLQSVRDREAQRRQQQANNQPAGSYETVEKNW